MAILIPADIHEPLRLVDVSEHAAIERFLGRSLNQLWLEDAGALLVVQEGALTAGAAQNHRATAFSWIHHHGMHRQRWTLNGPVLLMGLHGPRRSGHSVPAELVNLLIPAGRIQMQFRDHDTKSPWLAVGHDDDWYAAYAWMLVYLGKTNQTTLKLAVRAVPALSPSALEEVAGIGRRKLLSAPEEPEVLGSSSILSCTGVEDLATQIRAARLHAGYGFHWRDLCLLNLSDEGEHWMAIRHGFGFSVPPLMSLIEEGQFAGFIARLMTLTRQQAAEGTW